MKEALNSLITPPTYDPALKRGAFELLPVRRKGLLERSYSHCRKSSEHTSIYTRMGAPIHELRQAVCTKPTALEFNSPHFLESIRAMLEEIDLEPNYPKPELAERVLMRNATFTDSCCRRVSLQ